MVNLLTDDITLHFCSAEMAKIAHALSPILSPPAVMGSEEERELRQNILQNYKLALVALCREEAACHLVKGNFELAVPAASYALRFTTSIPPLPP